MKPSQNPPTTLGLHSGLHDSKLGTVSASKRSAFYGWVAGLFPNTRAFWYERVLRSTASARVLLASGGLAIQIYFVMYLSAASTDLLWAVLGYWLFSAMAFLTCVLWPDKRGVQATISISVDIAAAIILYGLLANRTGTGNSLIHAWPVIEAAILGSGYMAGLVAALLTSYMLVLVSLHQGEFLFTETGVVYATFSGIGLLALGTLTHQLVSRIAVQESLNLSATRINARLQVVTRLAVARLEDGMLVMTRSGRLDLANPAALTWLGLQEHELPLPLLDAASTSLRLSLAPLLAAIAAQLEKGSAEGVRVQWDVGGQTHDVWVSVRVAAAEDEEAVIVVLRDAKILELRLHEAKLAAMGRLVAAIAHEVRNPLSAVTQAAELLRETTTGGQARLTQLILTNSARINSTVEDVLALGRRERTSAAPLALRPWLVEWLNEQHAGDSGGRLTCLSDELERGDYAVQFQPEHLRRVLNNLLENALRYCSRDAGAVVLRLGWQRSESSTGAVIEAELVLANDGVIIDEQERTNLFEPFNSSEARGTGLGLYISRELCAKNGASLNYRVAYSGKSEFVIRVPVMQVVESHV